MTSRVVDKSNNLLTPGIRAYIEAVNDFLNSFTETFYWFGDNNYTEWEDVFSAYTPPPYHLPGLGPAYSFGLAGNSFLIRDQAAVVVT